MKQVTHHLRHYIPLVGILFAGILGFTLFSYDKTFQFSVIIASAFGYIVWGLVHHYIHKDLHTSVILEYIAIATIGVVIVFTLLFRA